MRRLVDAGASPAGAFMVPLSMTKGRLEAFSDGVIAIIITIMVLDLKVPQVTGFEGLKPLLPTFLSYVLSFVYVGIYWNNHHHLLQCTARVSGRVLWANLHLLFWLSLIPFVTGWLGSNRFDATSTAVYGVVLFCSAVAFTILQRSILRLQGTDSVLAKAIGADRKGRVSLVLYAAAIGLAWVNPVVSNSLYGLVAAIWLVPDPRIERALAEGNV